MPLSRGVVSSMPRRPRRLGTQSGEKRRITSSSKETKKRELLGSPLGASRRAGRHLGVAAEENVGAAARHVGGDGNGAIAAGLRDDRRLALVVLGVEDLRLPERADLVVGGALLQLAGGGALQQVRPPLR